MDTNELRQIMADLLRMHVQLEEHAGVMSVLYQDVALEIGIGSDHVRQATLLLEDIMCEYEMIEYSDDPLDHADVNEHDWHDQQFDPFTF